ncbi:hypothetical protein ACLESD_07510 [Pyxidicoccus sp. 3LFB2]
MVLAVITSALASALLSATPITVAIEPLGFSVESDGEQVTVTVVKKGSVAAKEGLTRGMRIERIEAPRRRFARGPIGKLNETDLHDALMPTWQEPLMVRVRLGEQQRSLVLARKDPPPADEFPVIPLPPGQYQRLTSMQQMHYSMRVMNRRPGSEQASRPELKLEHAATARVVGGKLKKLEGGGFTTAWVYVRATLDADCGRPLEKVVLRGTTPGLPRTFTRSPGSAQYNARFEVDLPLWKPAAVVRACASKDSSLEVKLHGEMYCKEVPVQKTELTAKLAVNCEQASPAEKDDSPEDFSLHVVDRPGSKLPASTLIVGSKGAIELNAYLGNITPRPSEVSLVEVDARGKVLRRLVQKKVTEEERDPTFPVELDTKKPRTVLLAVELKFSDGSVQVGAPEDVEILTEAQLAEQHREIEEAYARMQAFQRKLDTTWKDPCEKIEDTVAWLKVQPEIEWASGDGRHSFSYQVKGARAPLLFSCHSP